MNPEIKHLKASAHEQPQKQLVKTELRNKEAWEKGSTLLFMNIMNTNNKIQIQTNDGKKKQQ